MDPKQHQIFSAPGHAGASGLRLPSVHEDRPRPAREGHFPRVDDRLVEPESRQEMVRGELIEAMPANPAHADPHARLDYVTTAHAAPGYIVSTDLLTRFGPKSDFATDVCVRKVGIDPETGARYLEELAFEIVNEQSLRHITVRAEDIISRGVRRLIVIFAKRREVTEWSQDEHRFVPLPLDGVLEDRTLAMPIPNRALLDAAAATAAVAIAVWEQDSPAIAERKQELRARTRQETRREDLLHILEDRGLLPSAEQCAVIEACTDDEQLARWVRSAGRVGSVAELLEA